MTILLTCALWTHWSSCTLLHLWDEPWCLPLTACSHAWRAYPVLVSHAWNLHVSLIMLGPNSTPILDLLQFSCVIWLPSWGLNFGPDGLSPSQFQAYYLKILWSLAVEDLEPFHIWQHEYHTSQIKCSSEYNIELKHIRELHNHRFM